MTTSSVADLLGRTKKDRTSPKTLTSDLLHMVFIVTARLLLEAHPVVGLRDGVSVLMIIVPARRDAGIT